MKHLYSSIYIENGISRTELARRTHLSKTTVSTLVDELIEGDFIADEGASHSDCVGRKPNCLKARTNQHFVIVISWVDNIAEAHVVGRGRHIRVQYQAYTEKRGVLYLLIPDLRL